MSDPKDQVREAMREVKEEFSRAIESAGGLARQAAEDLSRLVGDPRPGRRPRDGSPVELIRDLGRLRDEGLISEEEFQAKKAELLSRV
jgi:hypothetical protein